MSLLTRLQPRHRPTPRRAASPAADSLVLTEQARRQISAEARQAASAGWTPTAGQPEPAYFQVIDHQAAAAAHAAAKTHHDAQIAPLATMRIWLRATPVPPPAPGSHGPAARDQARAAQQYADLTDTADRALTLYEQNRHTLAAELGRIDHYRHTARHTYITTLLAHHPTPDNISAPPAPGPTLTAAHIPDHPDAAATRTRLHQLRHQPTPNTPT